MSYRKLKFGKFGIQENPVGLKVALAVGNRTHLGDVIGAYRDETRGMTMLKVRYFCGDMWPFDPAAASVSVI